MSYLTGDRRTSANGTKLGSLASTAREDVNNLINKKLKLKTFSLLVISTDTNNTKEDEQIKDLTKQAIAAIGTENEYDTYSEFRDGCRHRLTSSTKS